MTKENLSFNRYNHIQGTDKNEFYMFIESLANATYSNFENIKDFPSIDVSIMYITIYLKIFI